MNNVWIACNKTLPHQNGTYLIVTANGKIRIDRFVDGAWGLCLARPNNDKGRYRPHLAWTFLPKVPQFDNDGNIVKGATWQSM